MLRTVPTIVIAHTVSASRDTRISYGWCLLIQGYFWAVQSYAEKAELSKCSWYPKRKLGVTTHFSEIIKSRTCGSVLHRAAMQEVVSSPPAGPTLRVLN